MSDWLVLPILLPIIGAALCIFLMKYLDGTTWLRFGVWLVLGILIYLLYGYRNSRLRTEPQSTPGWARDQDGPDAPAAEPGGERP